jgi:hypothetical protein
MGDATGAEGMWTKALDMDPDNSQAKMYLRMLERSRNSLPPQPGA